MNDKSNKGISLMAFWGSFGTLITLLVLGAMSFNTRVAKMEEKQDSINHEVIRNEKDIYQLDQAQREIMLQLKTIESNQLHQNELLQEIKTSLR